MKKILYLSLICLVGLSACSSEHIALDAMKVYDVANGDCKLNLSMTDTRPDFYDANVAKSATLTLVPEEDGVVKGVLEDVEGNCALRKIYVQIANDDNRITLVVYHNIVEYLTDCLCYYDVNFKMSKLPAGHYDLKIYFAHSDLKYTEKNLMFSGPCTLEKGRATRLTLKEGILPD